MYNGYEDSVFGGTTETININSCYSMFVDNLFCGVDWVYVNVQNMYIYDYKLLYFTFLNNIFSDNIDYFFLSLWYANLTAASLQFFWSVMLDFYISNNLPQLSLTDEWVRSYITSKDVSLLIVFHPEIIFYKNQILSNFFFDFLGDVGIGAVSFLEREKLIEPIMLFPQLVFLMMWAFIFVSFFFSFFSTSTDEESTIDADYLSASVTVESEKEIGSLDDLLIPIIIYIYTFGWYAYLHCWCTMFISPELSLFIFFFPLLYYTIVCTPSLLLYDFGIFYTCFLRGISPSSVLVFELIYDYIAVIAFYVRVLVQSVRLALMLFAYASMHDYVLYQQYTFSPVAVESIWESLSNIDASVNSVTYFILGVLPGYILYWIYELIHTFFVVTGQLVAYLAMVFWLFLFLFTFFIAERFENYFAERIQFRKTLLEELKKLKK